jgi:hypothetical protein
MKEVSLLPLFRKSAADLSRGYYTRGDLVRVENRSQYNALSAMEPASLGMGIVQAVLAVLSLHIDSFAWGEQGRIGKAAFYSTSKRPKSFYTYEFSWDERDETSPYYGGFANGLTYQLVMLHLITSYLDGMYQASEGRREVLQRWYDLVRVCDAFYDRDSEGGWSEDQIVAACLNQSIQPHIERVSDALWFSMRYQLPDKRLDRTVRLRESDVLGTADLSQIGMNRPGRALLIIPKPELDVPGILDGVPQKSRERRLEGELVFDKQTMSRFQGERGKRIEVELPLWELPGENECF